MTTKLLAPLAILATVAAQSSAQLLDWLPIQDLPLTRTEVSDGYGTPAVAAMCMWDPDGPGPLTHSIVVAGALNSAAAGPNHQLAYLNDNGWVSVATPGGAYSVAAYRSPQTGQEDLYYGASSEGIFRRDGSSWTQISTLSSPKAMHVLDVDGEGPGPAKLYISSGNRVYAYDGTSFAQVGGTVPNSNIYGLAVWDVGGGSLSLLAAGPSGVARWNGTQWSLFAATNGGNAWTMCGMDFDGDGPGIPELVVCGSFTRLGGAATGPVAVWRAGTWVGIGATDISGQGVYRSTSFDPDGSGPMTPRLVIAGQFSTITGVNSPNLAYYQEGAWYAFPTHWNSVATCLGVNDSARFSDSPQLVVGALIGLRPALGIVALCTSPAGYENDPAGGRRPQGETLSIGVVPTGDELSFRWYKGTTPVVSGTTASGSVISGTASPRLTISGLTPQDEGEYHLTVGNAFGVVTTQPASISLGCAADMNADDIVDFPDYLDFITAFVNGDPVSDFNNDMEFDLFDYLDFVQHFANGC